MVAVYHEGKFFYWYIYQHDGQFDVCSIDLQKGREIQFECKTKSEVVLTLKINGVKFPEEFASYLLSIMDKEG